MTSTTHSGGQGTTSRPDTVGVPGGLPVGALPPTSPGPIPTGRLPRARPGRSTLRLYSRLTRRGTLLMALALGLYVAMEVASYRSAYPDGVSPLQFEMFRDNPAVRMMNGVPDALDTAGGFTVWDGGWFMQLILAVWAVLAGTRLLRGEEEVGRVDLLLVGPIRGTRVTAKAIGVLLASGVFIGAVVAATMLAFGQSVQGSLLLGLALAGVQMTFVGVGSVTSQLVEVRRRAAGLAAAAVGLAYVVRMIGSSTDPRAWIRWFTPLGWLEQLRPFGDVDLRAVVPLLLVPALLSGTAVWLRGRRDLGAAVLAPEASREPRLRYLDSPLGFAWRSNRAVLLAWVIGIAAYSALMGSLVSTMVEYMADDESYQRIMEQMGMSEAITVLGFFGMMGLIGGLVMALQVVWRIGAMRTEEETGRAEAMLSRRVARLRWLGGHTLLAAVGGLVLIVVSGLAMWAGAVTSGPVDITWWQALRATLNVLPIVVLVAGMAVAAFGLAPRLTVAAPVAFITVTFVVSLLGPALEWPMWVLDVSPFTHLAMVPAEPWAATSGIVMTALGLAMGVAGFMGFRRRDVVGG